MSSDNKEESNSPSTNFKEDEKKKFSGVDEPLKIEANKNESSDNKDINLPENAATKDDAIVDCESSDSKSSKNESSDNKDINLPDNAATKDDAIVDCESSDNKISKNDVREDDSVNDDDSQPMDESSMDSEPKDNEKDHEMKDNDKDDSEKEDSVKEESEKEESEKEESEKEESEKEGSEKDEKESDEENGEKEMGLLDRPVEVTGCRARKQVDRLEVSFTTPNKERHEIVEGSGQKLGDCPRIEFQISKHIAADLKPLHRILYSRPGSVSDIKKNIRKFSGFDFGKNSHKFDQKKVSMEKLTNSALKFICEILSLERSGTKDDIIMRILEFLLEPKDSGKALPKKKGSSRDRKKSAGKKVKITKKKTKAKVTDEDDDDDDVAVDASDENEDADDDEENEDEDSDYESKKKSKSTPKRKTLSKTKAVKKEKSKKETNKGIKRKRDIPSDDSEDDEPDLKKPKIPSDEEIKKLVKRILDNADLEEITMKKVIKQVFDTYPEYDLSHKKAFIKMTIKSVIS